MRVAIFVPEAGIASETFVRDHIESLPFEVVVFYGCDWSLSDEFGRSCFRLSRAFAWLLRRWSPKGAERFLSLRLAAHLKYKKIDVALAEFGTSGAFVAPPCSLAKVPLVCIFHGFDATDRFIIRKLSLRYNMLFATAFRLIAVSDHLKKELVRLGADEKKIVVSPCGARRSPGHNTKPSESRVVLSVGRFVEKKAPHLLLISFAQVLRKRPDVVFEMVGDGPLLGACLALARALKIESAVFFRGSLAHGCVTDALKNARIFVQHSVVSSTGDSEGSPVAIAEAMMAGLPVISTRHGGIASLIDDDVTGFLVDEFDAERLAEKICALIDDDVACDLMGERGRERAIQLFSREDHLRQLVEVLLSASSQLHALKR